MGKKRNTLGTTGSPVTNDLGNDNSGLDNITRAASGSSLYQENSGASDVGGRMQNAGFTNGYFNGKLLGFDTGEVTDGYKRMGNDSFDPFSNNNDYEKIRKDNQSAAVAYTNMFGQFVAKTALNTVGGVLGSFYGLGSAVVNGDATKLIDNSFLRGVDEASEGVDELAPVFTSQADKEKGVFGIFSGLETVKSVSDAFAFTSGAVLTELIMQTIGNAVTGGAAELGVGARLARYAAKTGAILGEERAIGRTLVKGGEYIGVGDKLKRIGERAELAGAFLKDVDSPAARAIIEKAAMKEGMSLDQLQNYMKLSQKFDNFGSGLRKVMSGSLYEGSLEGRQAYDKMMQNADATIDAQLTSEGFVPGEKRDREKEKRLSASEQDAKNLMLGVTAANVGLLSISNALQFPTLFGMKSFPATKSVDNMSSLFLRDAVSGTAKEIERKGIAKIGAGAVKVLEHPFQEFLEETLQGVISKTSQNFHDRLTETASQTAGMEQPVSEFVNSLWNGLKEEYGSKEGWEEGLIGAIVGGIGAPSFKRNSKGKIRPTMAGGIIESLQGRSKEEKARIQDALDVLNSDSQLNSLKYNLEQSKLNSFSTNEKNKSVAADDDKAFESAGTDEVFQHVANYLDKGLKDSLQEETEALKNLSPEEYTLKTRGKDQQVITAEEQKAELDDYTRKVKTYTNAYEKVFKSMRMDKMNDNPINQRLLNHLAYAVAKDKEELLQFDNQSKELKNKGLKMTESELYALALMHGKIGTKTDKEIQNELSRYDTEEHPAYGEKVNKLIGAEYSSVVGHEILDKKRDYKKLQFIKSKYGLDHASFSRDLAKKYRKETVEESQFTPEFFEDKTRRENRKRTDFDYKFKEALKEKISEKIRKENEYKKEDYVSKEALLDENARIAEKNNILNREAADKFQQKQSAAMDHLAGKPKAITLKDINDYKESLQKYKEQLTADETVPRSFLDQLDSYQSKDINKALDKLAGTIMRREASLRVAANLYGLEGVNRAVKAVANAELVTNYNNNRYFRKALVYFNTHGGEDETGGEASIAYNKLKISVNALQEMLENFKKVSSENGIDEDEDGLIKTLEREIKLSNTVMTMYQSIIEDEDARDEAEEKARSEAELTSSKAIADKMTKTAIDATEEEVEEARILDELILKHGELVNQAKTSWKMYSEFSASDRDNGLRDLIEKGSIGMQSVVYLRPSEDLAINDYMEKSMNAEQKELYKRGLALYEEDPTVIGDKDRMDINKFMEDGKLVFDDSDDAALQQFVMTFSANKEITNDTSFKSKTGKRIIDKKEGDERIFRSSFLYTPYFSFDGTGKQAEEFAAKLALDKKRVVEMTADMNAIKDDSNYEKLLLDKRIKLLQTSIKARELRANDSTLYELRRKMLMGRTLHKASSSKEESYAMETRISDFDYGMISPHTKDGVRMADGYNNNPIIRPGEGNVNNFGTEEDFLADEATAQELFDNDKLAICHTTGRSLVYLNSGGKIDFHEKKSTEDTAPVDDKGTAKTVEVKVTDNQKNQFTVGAVYYMHETKTGVLVPVKLNMMEIGSNQDVMDGLRKHIKASIDKQINQAKAENKDLGINLKIYDQPIDLEDSDFNGMFANEPEAPKTLHELIKYFLPHTNSVREIGQEPMVYKPIGLEAADNQDPATETPEDSGKTVEEIEEEAKNSAAQKRVAAKKPGIKKQTGPSNVDFGSPIVKMEDFTEADMDAIMGRIGSMRYYLKKDLFIDRKAEGSARLSKPGVFNFAMTSGLINHNFEVSQNVEKIYSKYDQTSDENEELDKNKPKQVGVSLTPMDDNILNETRRILGKTYSKNEKKEGFLKSVKKLFGLDSKYYSENKIPMSLYEIGKQTKHAIDQSFKEQLKSLNAKGTITENERKNAYSKAVTSTIASLKSQLDHISGKETRKDRKDLINAVKNQIDVFEKQYKDPKNAAIFKAIYTNKQKSDYIKDLDDLLFDSNKLNTDLAEINPGIVRENEKGKISYSSPESKMTKGKVKSIIEAVNEHIKLSLNYKTLGGKDFLPVDISISTLEKNKKGSAYGPKEERHSIYKGSDGSLKSKGSGKPIQIYADSPFFYESKSTGKLVKLEAGDLEKELKFDSNGKLIDGVLFLHVSGYGPNEFIPIAIGSDSMNESNSADKEGYKALKQSDKKFRYVSGLNFFGRNSDLSLNTKEESEISRITNAALIAGTATADIYKRLTPKQTAEDAFAELQDQAEADLQEALDAQADAEASYQDLIGEVSATIKPVVKARAKASVNSATVAGLSEEELGDVAEQQRQKSLSNIAWLRENGVPDIEDGGDLDKYGDDLMSDFMKDPKEAVGIDFTEMSDKEFTNYLKENTRNDGAGALQEVLLKAVKINPERTKGAMNDIIEKLTAPKGKSKDKEKGKKKSGSFTAMGLEGGEEDENEVVKKKVVPEVKKEEVKKTPKVQEKVDTLTPTQKKQFKSAVIIGSEATIKDIVKNVKDNNRGNNNSNSDIFVSAMSEISNEDKGAIVNNDKAHFVAKVILGQDYSKEEVDKLIEDHNKCL